MYASTASRQPLLHASGSSLQPSICPLKLPSCTRSQAQHCQAAPPRLAPGSSSCPSPWLPARPSKYTVALAMQLLRLFCSAWNSSWQRPGAGKAAGRGGTARGIVVSRRLVGGDRRLGGGQAGAQRQTYQTRWARQGLCPLALVLTQSRTATDVHLPPLPQPPPRLTEWRGARGGAHGHLKGPHEAREQLGQQRGPVHKPWSSEGQGNVCVCACFFCFFWGGGAGSRDVQPL